MPANSAFTFTRTLLGLPDLVIPSEPLHGAYTLETFGRPGRVPVNSVASSGLVHGDVIIRSKLQQATIPFSFFVQGGTVQQVENRIDNAEDCFSQFSYAVSVDIGGAVRGYVCDPSPVQAEQVLEPWVTGHIARLSVVLSVYPLASS